MPGVVAFLATLVAVTVIGQLMTQSLYDAATAVGDWEAYWGVKAKVGSTSDGRRHRCRGLGCHRNAGAEGHAAQQVG